MAWRVQDAHRSKSSSSSSKTCFLRLIWRKGSVSDHSLVLSHEPPDTHSDLSTGPTCFTLRSFDLFQQPDELLLVDPLAELTRLSHLDEEICDALRLLGLDE